MIICFVLTITVYLQLFQTYQFLLFLVPLFLFIADISFGCIHSCFNNFIQGVESSFSWYVLIDIDRIFSFSPKFSSVLFLIPLFQKQFLTYVWLMSLKALKIHLMASRTDIFFANSSTYWHCCMFVTANCRTYFW